MNEKVVVVSFSLYFKLTETIELKNFLVLNRRRVRFKTHFFVPFCTFTFNLQSVWFCVFCSFFLSLIFLGATCLLVIYVFSRTDSLYVFRGPVRFEHVRSSVLSRSTRAQLPPACLTAPAPATTAPVMPSVPPTRPTRLPPCASACTAHTARTRPTASAPTSTRAQLPPCVFDRPRHHRPCVA